MLLLGCEEYNDDRNRDGFRKRERLMIRLGMFNGRRRTSRTRRHEVRATKEHYQVRRGTNIFNKCQRQKSSEVFDDGNRWGPSLMHTITDSQTLHMGRCTEIRSESKCVFVRVVNARKLLSRRFSSLRRPQTSASPHLDMLPHAGSKRHHKTVLILPSVLASLSPLQRSTHPIS